MGRIAGRSAPPVSAAVGDAHVLAARLTPILGPATQRVVTRLAPILEWHRTQSAKRPLPNLRTDLQAIGRVFDQLWTAIVESDPLVQAQLFAHVDSTALFELREHVAAALAGAPPRPPRHRPINGDLRILYSQIAFALRAAGVAVSTTETGKFARTVGVVLPLLQQRARLAGRDEDAKRLKTPKNLYPSLRQARDHVEPFGSDDDID